MDEKKAEMMVGEMASKRVDEKDAQWVAMTVALMAAVMDQKTAAVMDGY